jgi:hypothetical protein
MVTAGTPAQPLVAVTAFGHFKRRSNGPSVDAAACIVDQRQAVLEGGHRVTGRHASCRSGALAAPRILGGCPVQTPAAATGEFKMDRVLPGRYLIGTSLGGRHADSATWALKSVMADDKDITDRFSRLAPSPAPTKRRRDVHERVAAAAPANSCISPARRRPMRP